MTHWHVTSRRNRESIALHGLDWNHMGAARGIAGSTRPEQHGCFLAADTHERDWFVQMNNTGGDVDVWEVDGIDHTDLVESHNGHYYYPGVIDASNIRLAQRDIPPCNTFR